jgi:hypothetical protein
MEQMKYAFCSLNLQQTFAKENLSFQIYVFQFIQHSCDDN